MNSSFPSLIDSQDIFEVLPPRTELSSSGEKLQIVAVYIDDDHESVPYAWVATDSIEHATRRGRNAWTPVDDGSVVVGMVREAVIHSRKILDTQPWYKKSYEKQVKKAEKEAIRAVLSHLELV